MFLRAVSIALSILWLASAPASAADGAYVVISITGPVSGLKAGQQVTAGTPLDVPAGATIKLLSAKGQVLAIKGPHTGPLRPQDRSASSGDTKILASISKFLGERQVQTGMLGAIRSGPPRTREPTDPFMVLVGSRGAQCARGPQVQLWRRIADADASLEIRAAGAGNTKVAWPKGENALALPTDFVANGKALEFVLDGVSSKVDLHLAPQDATNAAALAGWLVARNCNRQAALFLGSLE